MFALIDKLNKFEILLSSSIISVFLTHLFYKFKLKSEQRIRFQNIIGDSITDSLIKLRDLIEDAAVIERYDIIFPDEDEDADEIANAFDGTIYPAIMNNMDSLKSFTERLEVTWKKHGKYLDVRTAMYLWYGSRYFSQLLIYVNAEGYQNQLPELGTMLIFDIQEWHLEFDKMIVKRINKPLNKIEHHQGRKWNWYRGKFMKQWENSLLYKSINDFHGDVPEINDFFEYLERLKKENKKRA